MTNYKQKRHTEKQTEKKTELLIKLNKGKVLKNKTNGYVFLNFLTKKQIKINQGKRRKNRDFRFSKPKYWEVLNPWKGFKIKSMYYLGLKRFI